ncbi:MAG TPA: cation diffusion facilitator family transporter [Phycisphaeraceae bacterium]|jgi:cobalt-zinc-cadmium efflux system protein
MASNHSNQEHSHAGHAHSLTRSDEVKGVSDVRLLWSVVLNQLLTVGQVVAGIFSGSIALLSDAAHNFNDANALLIAYIARRISRKKASHDYTFGYRRAELIGALINLTLLGVIGLYLVYEAISRFLSPETPIGWIMAFAAGLALVVDVATAVLLWAMSRGSLNVRAAFVHNLVDALASLGVLLGAAAVIWLDWWWIDPVLTLIIAGYVLWQVAAMMPQAARILMEGAPEDLDLHELVDAMESLDHVLDVHHLHAWQLDEQHRALEAHIVIPPDAAPHLEQIKSEIKALLRKQFHIGHATLEFDLGHPDEDGHDVELVPTH